jgi:hypothetical protein
VLRGLHTLRSSNCGYHLCSGGGSRQAGRGGGAWDPLDKARGRLGLGRRSSRRGARRGQACRERIRESCISKASQLPIVEGTDHCGLFLNDGSNTIKSSFCTLEEGMQK